jgi:hypothetical protein
VEGNGRDLICGIVLAIYLKGLGNLTKNLNTKFGLDPRFETVPSA